MKELLGEIFIAVPQILMTFVWKKACGLVTGVES